MTSQITNYEAVINQAVTRTIRNGTMFESIVKSLDMRVTTLEAASNSFEEAKRDMIALGLANLTEVLGPVSDDLLEVLSEAEARLAGLEGGNIFADHILMLNLPGFEFSTVQQAIEELVARTSFIGQGLSSIALDFLNKPTVAEMAAAINVLPLTGGTLTGPLTLAVDPTAAMHAATKQYVDGVSSGLAVKAAVNAASTANINLAAPGATIDGVTMASTNTFLAKDQSTPSQNGKYVWNGAAVPATRSTDMDAWTEVVASVVSVSAGTVNGNTVWAVSASPGGTIGTTAMPWNKFGSFQPLNDKTTMFANLSWVADRTAYWNGSAFVLTAFTTIGRAVAGAADAAAVRTAIGLGTAAVQAATSFAAAVHAHTLADISDAAAALAGKQAASANLAAWAGLTLAPNQLAYATGAGALALTAFTATGRSIAGAANAAAIRTLLGLSAVATTGDFTDLVGNIANGQMPLSLGTIYSLTPAPNKIPYYSSSTAAALTDLTAVGRTFLAAANLAAQQAALGLAAVATLGTVDALTDIGDVGAPIAKANFPNAARDAMGIDNFFGGVSIGDPVPGLLEVPRNQIKIQDGSMGFPGFGIPQWLGLCFASDVDTGFIRPGANRFGIVAGGDLVADIGLGGATFPKGVNSIETTIGDNNAVSFPCPNACMIDVVINNASPTPIRPFGRIATRCLSNGTGSIPVSMFWNDASNIDLRSGAMGGTTGAAGTIGKLSFSAPGDGNVYVQNRLGADLTFRFTIIGAS